MQVRFADAERAPAGRKPLDAIDRNILRILSTDARLPVVELARRVGLTASPCRSRILRLQELGYILGFRAVLNPAMLELEHVAFTEVKLRDTSETTLQEFNKAVREIPEIEECHLIAGSFDFLLKVRTRDIRDFRTVLGEKISKLPGLANTSTHISMESVKELAY